MVKILPTANRQLQTILMHPSEYQDIGQYLRESRESLRITLEQAATALHIRAKYLGALESGNLHELPGKSYTRGYIRNYAHYLMLDVDEVLAAYAGVLGPKLSELFVPEPTSHQNIPTHRLLYFSLAGLIVLYSVWYFGFHDRSTLTRKVPEVPYNFAHLLDKNNMAVMDRAWAECLNDGDAGCMVILQMRDALTPSVMIYDIPTHEPPFQP